MIHDLPREQLGFDETAYNRIHSLIKKSSYFFASWAVAQESEALAHNRFGPMLRVTDFEALFPEYVPQYGNTDLEM